MLGQLVRLLFPGKTDAGEGRHHDDSGEDELHDDEGFGVLEAAYRWSAIFGLSPGDQHHGLPYMETPTQ